MRQHAKMHYVRPGLGPCGLRLHCFVARYGGLWPTTLPAPPIEQTPKTIPTKHSPCTRTALGPTIRQAVAGARARPALADYTRFSDLLSAGTSALFSDLDLAGATGRLVSELVEAARVRS